MDISRERTYWPDLSPQDRHRLYVHYGFQSEDTAEMRELRIKLVRMECASTRVPTPEEIVERCKAVRRRVTNVSPGSGEEEPDRYCPVCGIPFRPTNEDQLFCSKICYILAPLGLRRQHGMRYVPR